MTPLAEQLTQLERDSDIDFQMRLIGNYLKRAYQNTQEAYELGMYYDHNDQQILELLWNIDSAIRKLENLKRV